MTGPIPSEISTLTKLDYLYAPSLVEVIECWSWFLLSVGHARLWPCAPSLSFSSFFLQWSIQQCPDGHNSTTNISAAKADMAVCPQNGTFIECWSYALLSVGLARLFLSLSRGLYFHLQEPGGQPIGWDNPSSNICPGQTEPPVSPHFFFI